MATYAIGDIQGCYDELLALLEMIAFDPQQDTLWFAGDLVNRGPKSLDVLRFVKGLGASAITVLGNHDLHLLALWQHKHRHFKSSDTLAAVISAPDAEELLNWLRQQPLLHHDSRLDFTMVHAGLPPQWDLLTAIACAREIEQVLRGPKFKEFLSHMYGNKPRKWSSDLKGWDRLRFIVNCFTRLRFCHENGRLEFDNKGRPGEQALELLPWFRVPNRRTVENRIVFGHWSTLGYYSENRATCIDTGCLWGGQLSALRLDDRQLFSLRCPGAKQPGSQD